MKKKIVLGFIFLFSLIFLASCGMGGGNSDPGTTINTPTENKTPTTSNDTTTDGSSSKQGNTTPSSSSTSTQGRTSTTTTGQVAPTTTNTQTTPTSGTNTQTSSTTTPVATYTVDFVTDSETTIDSQSIEAGGKVTEPQAPSKASTAQYEYTFAGWFTDLSSSDSYDFNTEVDSSFALYAKWDQVTRQYTYTFYDWATTNILKTETADYGTQIVAPADATIQNHGKYYYTFAGWYTEKVFGTKVTTFPTLTEDVSYYAHFDESIKTFTVYWKNYDGTLLETDTNVLYETVPSYNGQTPTKPETDTYRYTFKGWDKELVALTDNVTSGEDEITFTADFNEVDKSAPITYYTITWKDDDGTDLLVDNQVEANTLPVYPNANPTKASTAQYTYTFAGWTPAVVAATEDATYTATYTETTRKYTYRFYHYDGETIVREVTANYGEPILAPDNPTKEPTVQYIYGFNGWYTEKTGGERVVGFGDLTCDVDYYARYDEILRDYTITWLNDDDSVINTSFEKYGTTPTHANPTKAATVEYSYTFAGWTPTIEAVTGDATYKATYTPVKNQYTYTFYDEDGTTVLKTQTVDYGTQITAPTNPTKSSTVEHEYEFDAWYTALTDGTRLVEFPTITGNVNYYAKYKEYRRRYTYTFYNWDGSVVKETEAYYGDYIFIPDTNPTKPSTIENEYFFNGWFTAPTGGTMMVTFGDLTGDVSYYAQYDERVRQYTITWRNDDNSLIDTAYVYYGNTPTHSNPTKTATQEYTYTFAGWTPTVTTVTEDATYTATYNATKNQYTYIFYDDNGTTELKKLKVDYGTQITAPTDPTKTATQEHTYTFAGWYTALSGGTKITTFPTLTDDVNYYARYNEVSSASISTDTAYSFVVPTTGANDIVITGSYQGTSGSQNKLSINASSGKLAPNGSAESHNSYQINHGTILSFSVAQTAKITVYMWGNGNTAGLYTITGPGINSTNTEITQTYKTSGAGDVTITIDTDDYIKRIEIEMVDESVVAESIEMVYLKTSKTGNTTYGNGFYNTKNAKTIYLKNESFDSNGIYGVVTLSDSTQEVVDVNNGLTFTGFDSSTTGKKTITASYTAVETVSSTFDIYVLEIEPAISNTVIQVKVDHTYNGTPGANLANYNNFKTVNQALDYLRAIYKNGAYTNYTMLMYIESGTYNEKVVIDLPNLTIVGEDNETTMIEYDSLYGQKDPDGFSQVTDSTQTMTIAESAENLTIYNLTISNYWNEKTRFENAGKDNEHRALAMLIYADKVVIQKSRLLGYQDTLEAMTGRSYFYQSYISGTVDFIFGTNCTIYFEECEIHSISNGSTDGGYINAFKGANKFDEDGKATDYVVYGAIYNKCTFTADSSITASNTSIARPWSKYSAVMIMNSTIGAHISTVAYSGGAHKNQRYVSWGSSGPYADDSTIKHKEYHNEGAGAISATQAGVEVLTDATEAAKYSTYSYIFGTNNGGVEYSEAWTPTRYTPQVVQNTISITSQNGYVEGLYVEFTSNNLVKAQYKKSTDSDYTDVDSELVRMSSNEGRVDVVGLTAGTYTVKIIDKSNNEVVATSNELIVKADDRSGYAHFNNSTHTSRSVAVGAYNVDGTLKTNAKVIYVTDETKNTVEYDGCVGLVAILQGSHSVPIDIRIIGSINTAQWNQVTYTETAKTVALYEKQSEKLGGTGKTGKVYASTIKDPNNNWNSYSNDIAAGITELNGLTSYASCSLKDKDKDSQHYEWDSYWNMCDITGRSNITIEGIGIDATIFQWGFTFANCNSIEVKNLTFDDYTEDAIGIQGVDSDNLDYGNFWIHNCTFEEGVNRWDVSYEQDKGDGDGSTDFKYAHNLTISYCKYNGTHKTNLIGANNAAKQYNITLHHNYYLNCKARLPLVRQANIHMYNNYYKGTTSTGISARAHAFAFVENCYFDGKNPYMLAYEVKDNVDPVGTTIKAIGNEFSSSTSTSDSSSNGLGIMQNGIFVLTGSGSSKVYSSDLIATRTTSAPSTSVCTPVGTTDYVNFDTNSTLFYYENGASEVTDMLSASEVPSTIPTVAGAGLCGGSFTGGSSSSSGGSSQQSDPTDQKSLDLSSQSSSETTFTSNVVLGDFTVLATSSKDVIISNALVNLKGSGSTEYRSIMFTATAGQTVTVQYRAAEGRHLVLCGEDSSSSNSSNTTGANNVVSHTFTISKTQTYYLYSASSGIIVTSIVIQ